MKKTILSVIMFLMVFNYGINACIMHFEPEKIVLAKDKVAVFTVYVELEHRKCPVPLEDTNYTVKGAKILGKGEWIKVKRNLYKQEIKVKATKDNSCVRIFRECEKKGISETCLNCGACQLKNK